MSGQAHTNEIVFSGPLIRIGRWRLPAAHPKFAAPDPVPCYTFVFPRTCLWIAHARSSPFVADPNVVTYYNAGQEYSRKVIAPDGDRCEYFVVEEQTLRQIIREWDPARADAPRRILDFPSGPSNADVYWRQREVYRHARLAPMPDALFIEETMITVLGRIIALAYASQGRRPRAPGAAAERRTPADISNHVRELVARDLGCRMRLSDLARECDVSVFHLCRVFRATVGRSIHDYRIELRLKHALERVVRRDADLTRIAFDLGFCSHSHFTAAFKRLFGRTPSHARQRL